MKTLIVLITIFLGTQQFGSTISPSTNHLVKNENSEVVGGEWVWNNKDTRLTKKGKKKLSKLIKKHGKDSRKIGKEMSVTDFEYLCTYVSNNLQIPGKKKCPNANFWSNMKWKSYKDVCNQPNYCPSVAEFL